jgi:hypothetical protein
MLYYMLNNRKTETEQEIRHYYHKHNEQITQNIICPLLLYHAMQVIIAARVSFHLHFAGKGQDNCAMDWQE